MKERTTLAHAVRSDKDEAGRTGADSRPGFLLLITGPSPVQLPGRNDFPDVERLAVSAQNGRAPATMYATYIFPRLMDWVLGGERFQTERRHLLIPAQGVVLEIGFGTGLNLPHYPRTVTALHTVDPVPLLPDRVAQRVAQAAFPVRIQHVSAERLPYDDATFDYAVSTFTLCTIPDPVAALREIRRVLKPDGRFLFLEHGRSDDSQIARWQDRLNSFQNWLGCGCNLNRRIDQLVGAAGLHLESVDRYVLPGVPRIMGEMYRGLAAHSGAGLPSKPAGSTTS